MYNRYIYIYMYIYLRIYINIYIYIYIYQLCEPLFENVKSKLTQKYILFKTSYTSFCSKPS